MTKEESYSAFRFQPLEERVDGLEARLSILESRVGHEDSARMALRTEVLLEMLKDIANDKLTPGNISQHIIKSLQLFK